MANLGAVEHTNTAAQIAAVRRIVRLGLLRLGRLTSSVSGGRRVGKAARTRYAATLKAGRRYRLAANGGE